MIILHFKVIIIIIIIIIIVIIIMLWRDTVDQGLIMLYDLMSHFG